LRLAQTKLRFQRGVFKMISDDDLYKLAIFLGSVSMILIVVYHFLEVNTETKPVAVSKKS
jgi:hypothetical protein